MNKFFQSKRLRLALLIVIPLFLALLFFFPTKQETFSGLMFKADQHFREKHYTQAVLVYLKVLKNYPHNEFEGTILLNIGDIYNYSLNSPEKAVKAYGQVLSRFPRSPEARHAYQKQGDLYFSQGDYEKALVSYQGLVDHFPNIPDVQEYRFKVAYAALKLKRYEPSRRQLMQMYEEDPNGAIADKILFHVGLTFFLEANVRQSVEVFEAFLERHGQTSNYTTDAQFYLANGYEESGKFEEALELFKKIRSTYPNPRIVEEKIQKLEEKIKKSNELKANALKNSLQQIQTNKPQKKRTKVFDDEQFLLNPWGR
ncbi:MAG: tetratricopeptide repeat protein [Deltaproteobacteria bacterium]|nr:tetratricopeptide repeat protein [Deltaproteobacteria bacterium]